MPRFNPIRGVPAAPPPPPLSRDELIPRIVGAARRPCWPIVPSSHGAGFCYFDQLHNTRVGTVHPTEAAARAAWEAGEDDRAKTFAAELARMTDAQLQAQADYWLKPTPTPPPVCAADQSPASVTLKTAIHTKRQCPIWIAQLTKKVPSKEFTRLNGIARAGGGYWSSFGPVDIHGFIFLDEAKALAFQTLVNPRTTAAPAPPAPVAAPAPAPAPVVPVAVPVAAAACETCPCDTAAQAVAIHHTTTTRSLPLPAWRQRLRPAA